MKKIIETIPLILIGVVLPLLGRPELLKTWPIIVIGIYGFLLIFSQPEMKVKKEKADQQDRNSLILIIIGGLVSFSIPVADFAYGKQRSIEILQLTSLIGLLLIWGAFLFRYWSIQVLGKFFSTKIEFQSDHQLIKNGPYKYFRHPSYLGAWIAQVGIAIFLQSIIGLIFNGIFCLAVYVYRIKCEERALSEIFPKEYDEYKKNSWGILPYIY